MMRAAALDRWRDPALVVLSLTITAIAWEIVGLMDVSFVFPPLHDVLKVTFNVWTSERFLDAAWYSVKSALIAFPISVGSGLVVGILMGRFRVVEWALDIWVNVFLSLPLIAFIPIIVLLFGLSRDAIIFVVFLSTFFLIVVNTASGVRAVSAQYDEMARAFGANQLQTLFRIILPGALPLMLTGIRLATGRCIRGVIYAEQIIGILGVGGLLRAYGGSFRIAETWALILAIAITGLLAMELVRAMENWMLKVFPQGQSAGGSNTQ